jgi:hypothetical protein
MTKIVINKAYSGFSLSNKGMKRYAALKDLTLWPEEDVKSGYLWMEGKHMEYFVNPNVPRRPLMVSSGFCRRRRTQATLRAFGGFLAGLAELTALGVFLYGVVTFLLALGGH